MIQGITEIELSHMEQSCLKIPSISSNLCGFVKSTYNGSKDPYRQYQLVRIKINWLLVLTFGPVSANMLF